MSEDTLRTIFQSRLDAYRAELEASHILIELASDADDATVAAAREQVEKAQLGRWRRFCSGSQRYVRRSSSAEEVEVSAALGVASWTRLSKPQRSLRK